MALRSSFQIGDCATNLHTGKPDRVMGRNRADSARLLSEGRITCRSQWPRGLRRRSAAAPLLRSWVRIPPGAWMFVCCECCVLSGRGLCDELITRPEESYRLWCVIECDLENLKNEEAMTRVGSQRHRGKKKNNLQHKNRAHLSRSEI